MSSAQKYISWLELEVKTCEDKIKSKQKQIAALKLENAELKKSEFGKLVLVGYSNGMQLSYVKSDGEGNIYSNTDGDCYIPVYMLESHLHRISTTSDGMVTHKDILTAVNLDEESEK